MSEAEPLRVAPEKVWVVMYNHPGNGYDNHGKTVRLQRIDGKMSAFFLLEADALTRIDQLNRDLAAEYVTYCRKQEKQSRRRDNDYLAWRKRDADFQRERPEFFEAEEGAKRHLLLPTYDQWLRHQVKSWYELACVSLGSIVMAGEAEKTDF